MDESRLKEIAEIVAEIWLSGKNNSQVFDFHECGSRERWVARLVKLYEGKLDEATFHQRFHLEVEHEQKLEQAKAETLKEVGKAINRKHGIAFSREHPEDTQYTVSREFVETLIERGELPKE